LQNKPVGPLQKKPGGGRFRRLLGKNLEFPGGNSVLGPERIVGEGGSQLPRGALSLLKKGKVLLRDFPLTKGDGSLRKKIRRAITQKTERKCHEDIVRKASA